MKKNVLLFVFLLLFLSCIFSGDDFVMEYGVQSEFSFSSEDYHEHVFGEWITIKEANCIEEGQKVRSCQTCFQREILNTSFSDHKGKNVDAIDPTCVSEGAESGVVCSICSAVLSGREVIPKLEHEFVFEKKVESTCLEEGYSLYMCFCGEEHKDEFVPTLPHDLEENEILPTCANYGYTEHKCKVCGVIYKSKYVSTLPHKYNKNVVLPTCTSKGYTEYTCKDCGDTYKDSYTDEAHNYEKNIVSPTCTSKGYTEYTCKDCGDTYKDSYTDEAHNYEKNIVSPTCTTTGHTEYVCKTCGHSYIGDYTEKTPHKYNKNTVLPTLLDEGYTEYKCKTCGYSYTGDKTNYRDIVKNAYAENSAVLYQGIDISKWNHKKDSEGNYLPLDWASIKKSGIDYVIIKAGSTVGIDPTFEMNYKAAKAAGLDVGAYFYTYALNVEEAVNDAEMFVSIVKGKVFEYPLYMDFEDNSQKNISASTKTKMIRNFCATLQREGYYAGLYTGYYWMTPRFGILDVDDIVNMIDIWFAHIVGTDYVSVKDKYSWNPNDQLGHSEFGMWQYSHSGVIPGITDEEFDLNYSYKNYPKIIKELGLNGYGKSDSSKEYVWVAVGRLNVRSSWDISTSSNIIGVAFSGDKFEIIERTEDYVKINYKGKNAFISADTKYVSFTQP